MVMSDAGWPGINEMICSDRIEIIYTSADAMKNISRLLRRNWWDW